jgi:hypothetical protein
MRTEKRHSNSDCLSVIKKEKKMQILSNVFCTVIILDILQCLQGRPFQSEEVIACFFFYFSPAAAERGRAVRRASQ